MKHASKLLTFFTVLSCATFISTNTATAKENFEFKKISSKRIEKVITHSSGTNDTVTGTSGLETDFEVLDLPPAKRGEKFAVKWKCRLERASKKNPQPGILRMEFFTEKTGLMLTQDKKVDLKRGSFKEVFRHIGKSYSENGQITHWRFSLLDKDSNTLCVKTSPMWDNLPPLAIKQKSVWKPAPAEEN